MRIGVNLRTLQPGRIGGMESYFRETLKALGRMGLDMVVFAADTNVESLQEMPNAKIRLGEPDERRDIYAAARREIDLLWSGPYLDPLFIDLPAVVTIPDLQHEYFPHFHHPRNLAYRRRYTALATKRAQAILTLSQFSAQSIVETYPETKGRVFPTYLAAAAQFCDDTLTNETVIKEVHQRHQLPEQYFLYPANTWIHKNHATLFQAIAELRRHMPDVPSLVLIGRMGSHYRELKTLIRDLNLEEQVRYLGSVESWELPALYRGALAVSFVSLFEGFGQPLAEAMAVGTPIVAADATSIPEVTAEAAIYFDPLDHIALAGCLEKIMLDSELRGRLSRTGKQRSQQFSWNRAAKETLVAFEYALRDDRPTKHYVPLVSVVTPSYNQAGYIGETLRSVTGQDYPRIEHIVRDGGSHDGTLEVLKWFDDKILWVSEPDNGQAHAINKGVQASGGEILGWLNSDDIYYPGAVTTTVEEFLLTPNADIVYGEAHYINTSGDYLSDYPTLEYKWEQFVDQCFICQPAAFIRREAWNQAGGLDTSLQCSMDYELWLRLAVSGFRFKHHHHVCAGSRIYLDAKSLGLRRKVHEESLAVIRKHIGCISRGWLLGYAEFCLHGSDGYFRVGPITDGVQFLADVLELALKTKDIPDLWNIADRFRAEGLA